MLTLNHIGNKRTFYPSISSSTSLLCTKVQRENWHAVIATKPKDLCELEDDVILEVEVLQVDNLTLTDAEEFVDVREDVMGVTLNEPFVDAIESNNDVEIDSNNSSAKSDEDDETLYDFNSE